MRKGQTTNNGRIIVLAKNENRQSIFTHRKNKPAQAHNDPAFKRRAELKLIKFQTLNESDLKRLLYHQLTDAIYFIKCRIKTIFDPKLIIFIKIIWKNIGFQVFSPMNSKSILVFCLTNKCAAFLDVFTSN